MLFGFAINRKNGSSTFGVITVNTEAEVKEAVASRTGVEQDAVVVMSAAEALSQFDDVAFLTPAEDEAE